MPKLNTISQIKKSLNTITYLVKFYQKDWIRIRNFIWNMKPKKKLMKKYDNSFQIILRRIFLKRGWKWPERSLIYLTELEKKKYKGSINYCIRNFEVRVEGY